MNFAAVAALATAISGSNRGRPEPRPRPRTDEEREAETAALLKHTQKEAARMQRRRERNLAAKSKGAMM